MHGGILCWLDSEPPNVALLPSYLPCTSLLCSHTSGLSPSEQA